MLHVINSGVVYVVWHASPSASQIYMYSCTLIMESKCLLYSNAGYVM